METGSTHCVSVIPLVVDIMAWLCREGVQDASEFAWQMQLRYSWNDTVDDVVVRQVKARCSHPATATPLLLLQPVLLH